MTDRLDVLLINPGGREKIYQDLGNELTAVEPPLWCRLIGGYLRDRKFNISILDLEAEHDGTDAVLRTVETGMPRLVAMVVFGHQPSASTQKMVAAAESCRMIKEINPDIPVIIIGGHVSALPESTLKEEDVDFACKGEGPETVVQLLAALEEEKPDFSEVAGLVWDDGGVVRVNPAAPLIVDLDTHLHGDVWDLLPMHRYRAHNWQCFGQLDSRMPYASIYTSLGCPYKCAFCCINAPFDGNRYRMRSPEAVVAEIDLLYTTYGVKTFKIIDEMFVLNDRHVSAICELLTAKSYANELNFWAYARVDTVKPERLQLMRSAGIRWLALGIESGSKHVRDGAQKTLKHDEIVAIVRQIQSAGIHVIGNYIFGLPDDDLETMQETLELSKELNCEFANFYSAMAYPGSQLYDMAIQNNWALPDTWAGFAQHSYECQPLPTEKISAAEVLKFRDNALHAYFENPRYLDMMTQLFGWETRHHIEDMVKHRLRRKIVEEMEQSG